MTDNGRVVLAGVLPNRRDLWFQVQHHLEPEHFGDADQRAMYKLIERYYDLAGDIMPASVLTDLLHNAGIDESKQLIYEQLYADLASYQPADHEFRYAIHALKDMRARHRTGEAITTAFEILERGVDLKDRAHKGHEDARDFLYTELGAIDKLNNIESAPEGDIRVESEDVLQEYADKKSGATGNGILSGIPSVDLVTGGFQRGELALVAAYTGNGKSQMLTQICWDVAVMQGKNFFFATSETVRGQARRRMIARHSRLPQFGLPNGLNVRDIRDATLDPQQEKVLKEVLDDLRNNPAYGKMFIAQVPRGATLTYVESKMKRQGEQWQIDVVGIDYLALLKPDRKRDNNREELNDILKDAKVLATSFYNGQGVPIISPWQMSQSAFKSALVAGSYQLANLADTSEAEKCMPLWSRVLTPSGWLSLRDLSEGDWVIDPVTGDPAKISAVHEQGMRELLRVTFDDGSVAECSPGHVWRVRTTKDGNASLSWLDLTAEQMLQRPRWKCATPVPVASDLGPSRLDEVIHPYVLGVFLGDGGFSADSQVELSLNSLDLDIAEKVAKLLPQSLKLVNHTQTAEGTTGFRVVSHAGRGYRNDYMTEARKLGLFGLRSWEKFVPEHYLWADAESRRELLRGLLDTDGDATVKETGFSSASERLTEAVEFLARSLGFKTYRQGVKKPFYRDAEGNKIQCRPSYRTVFLAPNDVEPFYTARKAGLRRQREDSVPLRFIRKIERTRLSVPMRCIEVASESHLYVTDGFVVTHNTPDQILAMLHTDDNPHVTKAQFLKNRDGEIPPMFSLSVDYRNAYLGEYDGGASSLDVLSSPGSGATAFGETHDMMGWLNN